MQSPESTALDQIAVASLEGASETAAFTRALVRGDENAWRDFHDRYHRRLTGYLLTLEHHRLDAVPDLLQDTLVRAVRHIRVFEDEATLWSWLTVLARSAAADNGRKRSRWNRFLDRFRSEPAHDTPADSATDPAARLDTALGSMEKEQRQLLEEKYFDHLSVREIATRHDASEKAIEGRLSRARKKLQSILLNHES